MFTNWCRACSNRGHYISCFSFPRYVPANIRRSFAKECALYNRRGTIYAAIASAITEQSGGQVYRRNKQMYARASRSAEVKRKRKKRKTRTGCSFRCAVATRLRNRTRLEALPETRSQQEAARKQCFPVKTSVDGVSHSLARFARGQIYVGGVIHEKHTLEQDLLLLPLSFGELLTAGKGVQ